MFLKQNPNFTSMEDANPLKCTCVPNRLACILLVLVIIFHKPQNMFKKTISNWRHVNWAVITSDWSFLTTPKLHTSFSTKLLYAPFISYFIGIICMHAAPDVGWLTACVMAGAVSSEWQAHAAFKGSHESVIWVRCFQSEASVGPHWKCLSVLLKILYKPRLSTYFSRWHMLRPLSINKRSTGDRGTYHAGRHRGFHVARNHIEADYWNKNGSEHQNCVKHWTWMLFVVHDGPVHRPYVKAERRVSNLIPLYNNEATMSQIRALPSCPFDVIEARVCSVE